ncbi:ankyrin repeat [Cedratvirus lausannensis]|uniref:Ankyrin repeat n=1 Tax=Cedratvirus lausannensis TaxID=2023205 RepID=A0A285Q1Z1_9VIRU|nr:ankyrin repeat [Cedratvirus lausannensis]
MEIVYRTIFSFSEGHNFLNQQVCSEFRFLITKVHGIVYIDQLIKEGKKPKFTPSWKAIEISVKFGLLSLLEAYKNFIPSNVCTIAAKENNMQVLQWAKQRGYELDSFIYFYAAKYGNLEMAKWLGKNGCPWNESVCTGAAQIGNLEILQWARSVGWFYRLAIKFYIRLRLI